MVSFPESGSIMAALLQVLKSDGRGGEVGSKVSGRLGCPLTICISGNNS